jgi:hypothetical protein
VAAVISLLDDSGVASPTWLEVNNSVPVVSVSIRISRAPGTNSLLLAYMHSFALQLALPSHIFVTVQHCAWSYFRLLFAQRMLTARRRAVFSVDFVSGKGVWMYKDYSSY